MMNATQSGRSKGGKARAAALSPARRSKIARKAAESRWLQNMPQAINEGAFILDSSTISCAVLEDETRVITQATFLRALGRARSPKAGTGVLATADEVPFFLQADVLQQFIDGDLTVSTKPIFFRTESGGKGVGYDARLLPQVAEVYLRFRDERLTTKGGVPRRYEKMVRAADILMRALANVGIIALVDEATGFQRDRAADALARILERFIAKELRPWVKTFPDEYYVELFRLRGLEFPRDRVQRPKYFGHLTNDIIYKRLAPAVLEELKKSTPKDEKGRRAHKFFQRLSSDLGHPKLREHLASVLTIMRLSEEYDDFAQKLDRIHPRFGETIPMDFGDIGMRGL